ncbi:MAG: class I SAM-dependent methyltransferase [Sneathiella sp.]|nr:class I SAM-dependent methyltransferase [Sneathiella sp.]
MSRSSKFWDRIANFYSKQPVADEAAYQKKLDVTRDYFHPTMKILEFGCGTGSTAIAHAPFVKHIHAIDISAKMLAIARDKADATDIKNITFEHSSIDDFTAASHPLDVVMGHSILHLLENRTDAIAKVYQMLKPGGIFITSTACLGRGMRVLKILLPLGKFLGLLPSVQFFNEQELLRNLTAAGFKIDHHWQPGEGKALFIVAKKVE